MLQRISSVVYHIWRQTEEKLAYEVQLSATLMFRPHSDVLYDLTEHGVMGFILFYAIKKQNVADDDVIYALVYH